MPFKDCQGVLLLSSTHYCTCHFVRFDKVENHVGCELHVSGLVVLASRPEQLSIEAGVGFGDQIIHEVSGSCQGLTVFISYLFIQQEVCVGNESSGKFQGGKIVQLQFMFFP